jgi:deoxyuridine 5'-triphosphate nucleotidohydrolase
MLLLHFYLNESARTNGLTPLTAPKPGDAGYDIRSNEQLVLPPGEQTAVATGLHVHIPSGMVGILKDRSSMARAGLRVSGGVIDASYRGEILVLLENRGHAPYTIKVNDRIVQMLVVACHTVATSQVADLADLGATERGGAGFGSTGVN